MSEEDFYFFFLVKLGSGLFLLPNLQSKIEYIRKKRTKDEALEFRINKSI